MCRCRVLLQRIWKGTDFLMNKDRLEDEQNKSDGNLGRNATLK